MNRFMITFKWSLASMTLVLGLMGYLGCTKHEAVLSDFDLYKKGTDSFEKEKYQESRKYFQDLEALYPESRYLSMARVGTANTYYEEGTYDEAIMEYQKVLEFYPVGKLSDWSQYRIGMSHFRQILDEDRDQEETRQACSAFETFLAQYPKNPLAGEAKEKYQICRDRLGGNELCVARFYFKSKAYGAAVSRLQEILTNYPHFTRKDEVFYYLAKSYEKSGNRELEKEAVQLLTGQYQDSKFTQKILKEKSDRQK